MRARRDCSGGSLVCFVYRSFVFFFFVLFFLLSDHRPFLVPFFSVRCPRRCMMVKRIYQGCYECVFFCSCGAVFLFFYLLLFLCMRRDTSEYPALPLLHRTRRIIREIIVCMNCYVYHFYSSCFFSFFICVYFLFFYIVAQGKAVQSNYRENYCVVFKYMILSFLF